MDPNESIDSTDVKLDELANLLYKARSDPKINLLSISADLIGIIF
jgi:hypothetical protein